MKNRVKIVLLIGYFSIASIPNNANFIDGKIAFPIIQTAKADVVINCAPITQNWGKCLKPTARVTPWGAIISECEWTGYTTDNCPLTYLIDPSGL